MSNHSWPERDARLRCVLKEHFDTTTDEALRKATKQIVSAHSTSVSLERIERSGRSGKKDQEALMAAAKKLEAASKHLSKVGWHGGKAILNLAQDVLYKDVAGNPVVPLVSAGPTVADWLMEISDKLSAASQDVPTDAPSFRDVFDAPYSGSSRPGPHKETAAYFTARECKQVFNSLSDVEGKVSTKSFPGAGNYGQAYGPILDFVESVFEALEISASAETWARAVVRPNKE